MRQTARAIVAAVLVLAAAPAFGQTPRTALPGSSFKANLTGEYLSRRISWDEESRDSELRALLAGLKFDVEFGGLLTLSVVGGLSLSDVPALTFRELPIALDYEAGFVQGIYVGGEIKTKLLASDTIEMDIWGRYVTSLGTSKTWTIEGFGAPGEATGKPNWSLAEVGPRLIYTGFQNAAPYLAVTANWLWGDFKMDETMGELAGSELKKVKGLGIVRAALGTTLDLSSRFSVWGEAGLIPRSGGVDWNVRGALRFSF
jgi:hypothetical protein